MSPVLPIRWPEYWSFSFSISPSSEHSGLISFRMDWLDLLAVQGTLKSLLQHHSSEAVILRINLCKIFGGRKGALVKGPLGIPSFGRFWNRQGKCLLEKVSVQRGLGYGECRAELKLAWGRGDHLEHLWSRPSWALVHTSMCSFVLINGILNTHLKHSWIFPDQGIHCRPCGHLFSLQSLDH